MSRVYPQPGSSRTSGFTLVELLVVLGMLLALAAILLPAVQSVRATAVQINCATKLCHIGMAYRAYAMDNNGHMVTPTNSGITKWNWVNWRSNQPPINQSALARYLNLQSDRLTEAFRCPATRPEEQMGFQGGTAYPLTFTMNCFLNEYPSMVFTAVMHPGNKILLYDENENADDDNFWYATARDTIAGRHGSKTFQVADINNAGSTNVVRKMGNVLFFDDHVELADNNMCHDPATNDPGIP